MSLITRLDRAYARNPDPDAVQKAINYPFPVMVLCLDVTEEYCNRLPQDTEVAVWNVPQRNWDSRNPPEREPLSEICPWNWGSTFAIISYDLWETITCPPSFNV